MRKLAVVLWLAALVSAFHAADARAILPPVIEDGGTAGTSCVWNGVTQGFYWRIWLEGYGWVWTGERCA